MGYGHPARNEKRNKWFNISKQMVYIHPKIPVEGLMTPSQRVQKDWVLLSLRSGAATLLMSTILRITAFPATQSGGYPLNHELLSDSWKIPLKWMFSWKIIELYGGNIMANCEITRLVDPLSGTDPKDVQVNGDHLSP